MDHMRILKRAFDITRVYRALWVFGILLALTTSRGGGGNGGGGGSSAGSGGNFPNGGPNVPFPTIPQPALNTILGIVAGVACLILLIAVVFAFIRYISMTASIRMVNDYEGTGEKVSVGQGFRLGWNRASFRLWLVDLIFGLVTFIAFILMLAIALAPLLLLLTKDQTASIIGVVLAVGLVLLVILVLIVVSIAISMVLQIIYRAIVLENKGVFEGIRRGWQLFRRRLGDVIIMALILFGIGLAFGLLMIPVVLLLLMLGVVTGGLPALLIGAIVSLFAQGSVPWIVGAIVGVPILLAVLLLPTLFIDGLFETFNSSTWTLTFRELLALESVQPPAATAAPAAPIAPAAQDGLEPVI